MKIWAEVTDKNWYAHHWYAHHWYEHLWYEHHVKSIL
jgi:hypothetical protein